jgi:AcrR family transcriptional regulator
MLTERAGSRRGQAARTERVGRLVDVAARLLVEGGPAGLSLRKLAAEAGTSTMAVYTLFGDKERLLSAMHREGFRRLGEALRRVPETDDPLADLLAVGHAYREAALASRQLYDLMFGRPVAEFSPDSEGQAAAQAAYEPLLAAVGRCQKAGQLTGDSPDGAALHLWAVAHGMVSLEIHGQLPGGTEPHSRVYAENLVQAAAPFVAPAQGTRSTSASQRRPGPAR